MGMILLGYVSQLHSTSFFKLNVGSEKGKHKYSLRTSTSKLSHELVMQIIMYCHILYYPQFFEIFGVMMT